MKHKYLAVLLGIAVASSSVNVLASDAASEEAIVESTQEEEAEDTTVNTVEVTLGEVTSIEDNTITIAVGTRKEMQGGGGEAPEKPDGEANGEAPEKPDGEANGEAPEKPDGEANGELPEGEGEDMPKQPEEGGGSFSMLDLTGEEMKVTVTDDTVILRQEMERPDSPEKEEAVSEEADIDSESEENAADSAAESENLTISDIQEGDVIEVTVDDAGNALTITIQNMGGGMEMGGGPGGQSQGIDSYDSVNEYTEDTSVTDTSLESTGADENAALLATDAEVTFDNVSITRKSSDSTGGDNSSFYGVGAALLATDGKAYVKDSTITTDAAGGAGIFAYGDGIVYAADSTIKTEQNTSGGIHAAGGGTLYAWNLDVETNGESAAAIRSDRGGGTMVVDGGTYVSNGVGSPAVYCTADITVNNATLNATGSEAVCIEGLNTLRLFDCDLIGNMSDLNQNDCTWTVILYQSMSGDSEVGNSTFQMTGGNLTSENGGVFYTTNTECTITLDSVNITYNDDSEYFLQCTGNANERGWGTTGDNGSDCHFTGIGQEMKGNIIWDSISNLDFYLTKGSSLSGAVVDDETYAGGNGEGYCNLYIENGCTWTVTGDSTVSALANEGEIIDEAGNVVTIVGTDGTVYVEGDSQYTITVDSYTDTADISESTTPEEWSALQVERPENL